MPVLTSTDLQHVESLTQQYGRELFRHMGAHARKGFSVAGWEDRFLQQIMADAELRTQLLRFVDVFPSLHSSRAIATHFLEYIPPHLAAKLPPSLRVGELMMEKSALVRGISGSVAGLAIQRMSKKFICGETPSQAVSAARRLVREGVHFSMDVLGEEVLSDEEADRYMQIYLDLLTALAREFPPNAAKPQAAPDRLRPAGPVVNLSIKLSALSPRFDALSPDETRAHVLPRLERIMHKAREVQAFIHVDTEQFDRRDLTLALFEDLLMNAEFRDYPHVGIVAQTYLRDAPESLRRLIDLARRRGTPFTIRLVKGAYWDYEVAVAKQHNWPIPVFSDKQETDACFEQCLALLLEAAPTVRAAPASHNIRSLAKSLALREALDVPWEDFELQILYGMGDAIKTSLTSLGFPVRVYAPFGPLVPGMGYLVRRLLENTANEGFLHQSTMTGVSEEDLLAPPFEFEALDTTDTTTAIQLSNHGSGILPNTQDPTINTLSKQYSISPSGDNGSKSKDTHRRETHRIDQEFPPPFANHAPLDFSRDEVRHQFNLALEQARSQFGRYYDIVVAGKRISPPKAASDELGPWIRSDNPSSPEETVGWVPRCTSDDARSALTAAGTAWHQWRKVPAETRARVLHQTADYLAARRFEFAAWTVYEAGKPWREADGDVCEAIDFLRYYASQIRGLSQPVPRQPSLPGEINHYGYRSLGPGCVIAPWNFPLAILTGMTSAALAAGNTVVMKPAEQTSICAVKILEAFEQGGGISRLCPDALQLITGEGDEVGAALTAHPETSWIAFTGSVATGQKICETAVRPNPAKRLITRVIAEMGGKNAIIVDSSADLDAAISGILQSAFFYGGQKCSAASRVIALPDVYDALLARLRQAAAALTTGPADHPATQVGPVIDDEAVQRIQRYTQTAPKTGRIFAPIVLETKAVTDPLAQEEIFGPVVAMLRARDFDEALSLANGTQFALTAGLYSRTPSHIRRAKDELEAGNIYINRPITGAIVDRQPFGGYRLSGVGSKAGGPDYMKQFLVPVTWSENTMRHGFVPDSSRTESS